MPTLRAFKECAQRILTVLVDGFGTTMVHARDGSVMKQGWSRRKHATVKRLMGCGPTNGKIVSRDPDADHNIRKGLALSVWPGELCRVAT